MILTVPDIPVVVFAGRSFHLPRHRRTLSRGKFGPFPGRRFCRSRHAAQVAHELAEHEQLAARRDGADAALQGLATEAPVEVALRR